MIIIISGINKSIALRECIEGPISTMYTCTVAQNHPKSIIVCDDLATNEIKVKTYKYYKNLQKNIDLLGNVVSNGITKYIQNNDKIMILSPHPDDDVIGMGGTMELLPNKKNVKIVYMTNGDGALNNNTKGSRLKEALSSIKVLGYDKENIIDANLPPFYHNDNRSKHRG